MTILQAIEQADNRKKNTCARKDKIKWLSQLDHRVKLQIIDTHEGSESVTFAGYDEDTDLGTVLLIPAPFDEMYQHWLEAQIYYEQMEEDRYNNAIDLFNTVWKAFRNWYNRTHMPRGHQLKF